MDNSQRPIEGFLRIKTAIFTVLLKKLIRDTPALIA